MNQHVDRRAILASSVAAATALAVVSVSQRAEAKGEVSDIASHPDAQLFQLEATMKLATDRMKKIERAQRRLGKKAEKTCGPRPLHPTDWKAPAMPDGLWEMHQSALKAATFGDVTGGKAWQPAPVAEWQARIDDERCAIQAVWDDYSRKRTQAYSAVSYDDKEAEFQRACDEEWGIGMQILAVEAYTLEGVMVKIRAGDRLGLENLAENDAYVSIAADIRRIAGEQKPVSPPPSADLAQLDVPRDELLRAYSEWLHYERQMLMRDIYPDQNMHEMMRYVPASTRSSLFHFPLHNDPRGTWETIPSPATRALDVMTLAGVDLKGALENGGW
ncbi:hypothetical protein ACYG9R_09140 [Mesorhizobium sp. RSR565B]|uniref:hypothetical protein n=1 Tax=Mesorhizobium sp. L103C565B0 TaxID=1287094 RepID=UPI0012DF5D23|nr:hypothetical protein [Mesorhizobium sp. L103C565B0]